MNSTLKSFLSTMVPAIGAGVLFSSLMVLPVAADEYADVSKMLRSGQLTEAIAKADQYLATKPKDPQMRFIKGVIQSEQGKSADAIATFTRLNEDYPELPEPYNNLAVLYASQNQFDKARQSLEMAIRTNPSYSTAHENLGDIYAKLASQAYGKALQLDGANQAIPSKLALIRELFAPQSKVVKPATAAAPAQAAATVAAATTPAAAKPATAAASTTPPAAPAAAATTPAVKAATPPPAPSSSGAADVEAALTAWAKAWSSKDMPGYLGAYGKDFKPAGKASRAAWEAERKDRIMGKSSIQVKLSSVSVTQNGDTATAKFKQDYKSDSLSTSSRKTLELQKQGDRWVITKEISG